MHRWKVGFKPLAARWPTRLQVRVRSDCATGFIGRVNDDALGRFYAKSMTEGGTDFVNMPVKDGMLPTSRCMIFVSPDGERSLNTYLGISSDLGPEDVSEDVAGQAEIVFLEGYLFDKDKGKGGVFAGGQKLPRDQRQNRNCHFRPVLR